MRIPLPKKLRREISSTRQSQEAARRRLDEVKEQWEEVHDVSRKVAKNRDRFAPLIDRALRGER